MDKGKEFVRASDRVAFDKEHRQRIQHNISRYDEAVVKGKLQFSNLELARRRAANIKNRVLNDLEKYLVEFEANFTRNGGKVIWASTKKEAVQEILTILKKSKASMVLKSKSIMTEELALNEILEKKHIDPIETDLGEYIVQLAGEKPYHILTPAMHKSKEDVSRLFNEKFGTDENARPEELTRFVRQQLREKFVSAGISITGANFLLADAGAVCLTENEGNAMMSVAFPEVHIAVAGIEKLLPTMDDLNLLWPLLATYGTGQKITVYNSIISGPRKNGEKDGPREMYVVLLDNHRSELLARERQRRALSCIRCGACLNACPVYRNVGGFTYDTPYSGPIGSVITPFLEDFGTFYHLSYASSLCGACTSVCPVKIPLHQLLLVNRSEAVREKYLGASERIAMHGFKQVLMSRKMMNLGRGRIRNKILEKTFSKRWGPRRELPEIQPKTFNQLWKEQQSRKET